MTKRFVGVTFLGLLASITSVAASCSFPTYNINVTSGTGGGTSASSSGDGGAGGASTTTSGTTSSGTGGSVTSTSTSTSTTSSGSASSSNGVGGFDGGACPVDDDHDLAISWQCPNGKDCADEDARAKPGADFNVGPPIKGATRPGTLPFDFDCDLAETKQTMTLNCTGLCLDPSIKGFEHDVDCGKSAALGHCGGLPCAWVSDSKNMIQLCK